MDSNKRRVFRTIGHTLLALPKIVLAFILVLAEASSIFFCTLFIFALTVDTFINKPDSIPWVTMWALVVIWLAAMFTAFTLIMRLNQTFFAWLLTSDRKLTAADTSPTTTRATTKNYQEDNMSNNAPERPWPTAPIIRIRRGHMPPCGDLRGRIAYRETPEAGYYVPELDVGLWQFNLDLQLEEWEEMVTVPKRIVDELRRRVAAHDDGYRRHEPVDGLYGLKDKIVSTARGVVRQADAGGEAPE